MIDERPWGKYEVLYKDDHTQVKRLEVKPGLRFSLQKHLKRSEKWIITAGSGIATVDDKRITVEPGSFVEIPLGAVHRLENTGSQLLTFIEVQFGSYLGEDDIIRFQDDFGRV
jgi:mannose-6-phosphate isomerase-like protein (cupin superfamily)